MGKLHTLRRAIERSPDEFLYRNSMRIEYRVLGAYFGKDGQWHAGGWFATGYKKFVEKVLRELNCI